MNPQDTNPQTTPTQAPAQPPAQPASQPQPLNPQAIYPNPAATANPTQSPTPTAVQSSGMFSGRLNRIGYLLATVYICIPLIAVALIQLAIHGKSVSGGAITGINILTILIGMAVVLITIPVGFSVAIRRWHDLNKSGWFMLLGIIPFVSIFVAIYLIFFPGTKGPNSYGDPDSAPSSPKKVLFNR